MHSIAQRRKKYPISSTSYHLRSKINKEDIIIDDSYLIKENYKKRIDEDIIGKNVKIICNNNIITKSARCTYECDDFISIRIYQDNFKQQQILKKNIKDIYYKDENKEDDIPSEKVIKMIDDIFQDIPHDMRGSEKKCWDFIKSLDRWKKDFRKKDLAFFIKNKLYEII